MKNKKLQKKIEVFVPVFMAEFYQIVFGQYRNSYKNLFTRKANLIETKLVIQFILILFPSIYLFTIIFLFTFLFFLVVRVFSHNRCSNQLHSILTNLSKVYG